MRTKLYLAAAAVGGLILGGGAVEALHAAGTAPGYGVTLLRISDREALNKAFLPLVGKVFAAHGGQFIVRRDQPIAQEGPGTDRIVIVKFPSLQAARDAFDSPEYAAARQVGDKYATFNILVAEGLPE